MWVVTVVDTKDDYKPRGGHWSEVRETKLFTDRAKVDAYIHQFYLDYIHMNTHAFHFEEGEKLEEYGHYFTRKGRVKREYRTSLPDLKMLAYLHANGTYIITLIVDVREVVPDEVLPTPSDSGDEEESDEENEDESKLEEEPEASAILAPGAQ
jgi:hypothetical protein